MINKQNFEVDIEPVRKLRRCTRCILPETMPFIEFDEEGVCNYCRSYNKVNYLGIEKLRLWAESVKRTNKQPNCLVSFSGGRDSCYSLHYSVKELGLTPIAFCYDWGIGTDISFRNQKKMCDALGIKLIAQKADINKKRLYIKKNITAWLKKPDLGMIPLFMAGDKQYFYYADKIRKRYGLDSILMAMNPFEKTYFKYGFCGVKPPVLESRGLELESEQLYFSDVIKLTKYYMKQYITNPSYINFSLLDTVGAAFSSYGISHNYIRLFNYIPWDEEEVNNVLVNNYKWETSPDSATTWRIGDGTAPFYNYIYYYVAGFTENDTLRSNQVREGMLTREEALKKVYEENKPRFESMKWYFEAIDMNMEDVLTIVKKMPRLY